MYDRDEKYSLYEVYDTVRRAEFKERLQRISELKPHGRLLDIGCSTGEFLELVSRTGRYAIEGAEISQEAARKASERLKVDVFCGTLEELPSSPCSYDVITAWEIIEHIPDPVAFLRRVHYLLKPHGICCLSTPNTNKLKNKISQRSRTSFFIPPEHSLYFSKTNLLQLLSRVGLDVLRVDVSSKSLLYRFNLAEGTSRKIFGPVFDGLALLGFQGYNIVAYGRKTTNFA
mgnify:CR=1 FL=1